MGRVQGTYRDYLKSPHWKRTSARAKARAGYRCQRCGKRFTLQTHHKTYKRIGRERPGDLLVLCRTCHRAMRKR